jgi:hypothetical protein
MKLFLIMAFVILSRPIVAQVIIQGIVTDGNGKAIPGANVLIAGSYDGTSTDDRGKFAFTTSEKGNHILVVTFVGYKTSTVRLDIADSSIELIVTLSEEISELQAVTINAGSFTASDASRRTVFRALDIATTAGATADIAGQRSENIY